MNASDVMTNTVFCCSANDSVERAAQVMWEHDCGALPVIDADSRVVGMITDRDICMAAYTQGGPLSQIPVARAMAKQVHGVRDTDTLEAVETLMRQAQIRRVPVLDGGRKIKGILSMNDLARHAQRPGRKSDGLGADNIVQTLAAISEPRPAAPPKEATAGAATSRSFFA